ncbi:MAG: SRPBCC domain-containing protein [Devosia nanyangense]|uniref:SRPBCC domain-containing protein n=1 Tax=Devosia nanyangense TaxID=1228055 RepID=A0A933NXI0_9HYPH|nr:SRPBCC domain-containing protein [Devosia nanyangense]
MRTGNVIPFPANPRTKGWVEFYRRLWAQRLDQLTDYIATLTETERETIMSDLKFEYPKDEPSMIVTRTFDAPRALVWKAFTDPVHVARWWGPKSFAPVSKIDKLELRPGGTWRYICQRTGGTQIIVFTGKYLEVKAPERLVNTFGVEGQFEGDEAFPETHTFEEHGGKTFYRSYSLVPSMEARDAIIATGMEKGGRESLEQLAALVAELQSEMAK